MGPSAGFRLHFGAAETRTFWVPGRVNLIGEHVDYCGGAVLPMPIQFGTRVEVAATDTGFVRAFSTMFARSIELSTRARDGVPFAAGHWGNYVAGTLDVLAGNGTTLEGADLFIDADIPASGLSSSASFTVALMSALSAIAGRSLTAMDLAHACRRVEHDWAGVECGIMDQAAVVLGAPRCALLFDCATEEARQIPLVEPRPSILVIDSGKARSLATTAYNERRADTRRAAIALGVAPERLATVAPARVHACGCDPMAKRRAAHVVAENARVLNAVDAIARGDWRTVGRLFTASHESLRSSYDVSCTELDALVELTSECAGVEGARMTGAGFGGAIVALVWPDAVVETIERVVRGYAKRFGSRPSAFVAESRGGATELG